MKKLISPKMIFLYILIFISVLFIFNKTSNNINYLSLGDSYSLGINSFGQIDYGYSDYLNDYLKSTNKDYKSYSECDIFIKMMNSNIISNNKPIKNKIGLKEKLQETDILTLQVGLNDLKYKIMLEDNMNMNKLYKILDEVESDYDELINTIKKYYRGDIYAISYPINRMDDYYLNIAIRKFNNYLETKPNIKYISTGFVEKDSYKYFLNPDSIYPNIEGYELIAKNIYKNINN